MHSQYSGYNLEYWVIEANHMGLIGNGAEMGSPPLSIPAAAVVPESLGQGQGQGGGVIAQPKPSPALPYPA